jgi:RNA polymerase sigma factor (sigma-70 family)
MGSSSLASFVGRLRRLVEPRGGGLDDAELLERFVRQRDEAAFEVLLWRYGPLVLGVCRRMLRREQDVEDAFQATFLTLVRKAGSIARRESLAGWLHQVAYRIGLRARASIARGGVQDQECVEHAVDSTVPADVGLRELLDQEVQRLPRRYRMPLILCYLDGKTSAEAARLLACPPGTIASRLAWARQRLRTRLTARGLEVPATVAALTLPVEMRAGPLPALIATALRTARLVATGTLAGSGSVPVHVIVWSKGVLRAMFLSKIQWGASLVLASVLFGAGGGAIWQRVRADGFSENQSDGPVASAGKTAQKTRSETSPSTDPHSAETKRDTTQVQLERDRTLADVKHLKAQVQKLDEEQDKVWASERKQRQDKIGLTLELHRSKRALELAETRAEKIADRLEQIRADEQSMYQDLSDKLQGKDLEQAKETMKKNFQKAKDRTQIRLEEAHDQVSRASRIVLDCEIRLLELDEILDRGKLKRERLERARTSIIDHFQQRMDAGEQMGPITVRNSSDARLQELENKLERLTRAVDELRKSLERKEAR